MRPTRHIFIKLVILSSTAFTCQWSFAADLPDLPEAFDAGWKGQKVCEVLYESETMRAARCTFPPGIGHEKHYHNPHFGYVLEGGTMLDKDAQGNEEVIQIVAGQTWSSSGIKVHQAVNMGDSTVSVLIVETSMKGPGSE